MAQTLSASIYGFNSYAQGTNNGVTKGFPTSNTFIEDISGLPADNRTFNGVECVSKLTILPTGLMLPNRLQYYSATAAATLITAANN